MKILITGGAGFIGSNIAESLLNDKRTSLVRVLDNLETGHLSNIESIINHPKFEFINGDIRKIDECNKACIDIDVICHQAALGSVPRSIANPLATHQTNVNGFINMLESARQNNIKRFVYASSSSVYGDLQESPKVESRVGKVLSPYASTKMTNELYAESYSKCYEMTIIGFRYFNVFGPKQDPEGPYAAVIPLFIKAALQGKSPIINGDGTITRDFTPVDNVVQINTNAIFNELEPNKHYVFNVACGQTTSLNKLWQIIKNITGSKADAIHGPNRKGDILHSLADVNLAKKHLDYKPEFLLEPFLSKTVEWYKTICIKS
ncbi:MAG: NAD-dependent epimerase/dehydratase family protein [Bacteroidetes bacterium]|nr:NAD-dependent epimerase/dehydratase family protein [Bacteroidota bacterium]